MINFVSLLKATHKNKFIQCQYKNLQSAIKKVVILCYFIYNKHDLPVIRLAIKSVFIIVIIIFYHSHSNLALI